MLPRYKNFASECLNEIFVAHHTVPVTSFRQIDNCFMSTRVRRTTVSCCKKKHLEIVHAYITTKVCKSVIYTIEHMWHKINQSSVHSLHYSIERWYLISLQLMLNKWLIGIDGSSKKQSCYNGKKSCPLSGALRRPSQKGAESHHLHIQTMQVTIFS